MKKTNLPEILNYNSGAEYLKHCYEKMKLRNSRFSVRSFAKKLGLKHSATLSRVLAGQRPLTVTLAMSLVNKLELDSEQSEYFLLITKLDQLKAKDSIEKYFFSKRNLSQSLSQKLRKAEIPGLKFNLLSQWYILILLEMFALKNPRGNPEQIASLLQNQVERKKISQSIEILNDLGLIHTNLDGTYSRTANAAVHLHTFSKENLVDLYHRKMIELSGLAIDRFSVDQRKIGSLVLALSETDVAKAKVIIEKAHQDLLTLAKSDQADEIYIWQTQFFPALFK